MIVCRIVATLRGALYGVRAFSALKLRALAVVLCLSTAAIGQSPDRALTRLPDCTPSPVAAGMPTEYQSTQPPPVEILPIDLGTAWRLAARQNPTIGWTRQIVQERIAHLLQASVIAVPNLNAGSTLHTHNGPLQNSDGTITNVPGLSCGIL